MQKFEGYIEKKKKKTHFGLSISTISQTCNAGEANLVNETIETFAVARFLGFFFSNSVTHLLHIPNPIKSTFILRY